MESGGEGHQMTLVADGDPYRVALGLPFEAFMPPDVFPFPREPKVCHGLAQPTPIEDTHRNENRRDEPLFQHAFHRGGLAQYIQKFGKDFMKPRSGWTYDRTWSAARLDRRF